ncbi:50S ribosomal protein L3 [Buchnera aphidicola (Nipponaphis monzeni)]|uniref:Large ribosomal subunit protein uL3 n=1 Tax=Buchnera aphidicola (Nipponaphis monzeni) TaxID=2495405 RepID=A0A455TAL4_9GAMM|nr:50S ribosomal protein L3 [Buchnera aphidicola]BBI01401.1 50S ribosomal protein L3 [Buchnera aphidicola (Nipponaphis monzeni)]
MIGIIGKKIGMTRLFTKEGISVPVTIIEIQDNWITQIKTIQTDRYEAVQLTTGIKKSKKLNKSEIGHFLKSGVTPGVGLWEFRVSKIKNFKIGEVVTLDSLDNIKKVDVTGTSKGKGFCGTVKRWNFKTQDASHGNSLSHRVPGSIGQNQTPGRVFKGKKMAGHLGNDKITIQNLNIVEIDKIKKLLLIKGSTPGVNNSSLIIKPAIKK